MIAQPREPRRCREARLRPRDFLGKGHRTNSSFTFVSTFSFLSSSKKQTEPATTVVPPFLQRRVAMGLAAQRLWRTNLIPCRKFPSRWVLFGEGDEFEMSIDRIQSFPPYVHAQIESSDASDSSSLSRPPYDVPLRARTGRPRAVSVPAIWAACNPRRRRGLKGAEHLPNGRYFAISRASLRYAVERAHSAALLPMRRPSRCCAFQRPRYVDRVALAARSRSQR
jgi:hypothetical protein